MSIIDFLTEKIKTVNTFTGICMIFLGYIVICVLGFIAVFFGLWLCS